MHTFPEWLQEHQITDEKFAASYEATPAAQRAWLKKTIAQVYAVNSPENPQKMWTVNTWRGGFETEVSSSALDWTLLVLDKGSVSAPRILAALTPALSAGIKSILVAFVGDGDVSQSVLTGFELAGQEDVVKLSCDDYLKLLQELLATDAAGAIIDLRAKAEMIPYTDQVRYWRASQISSICICKDEDSPDMDVLTFAHPDVEFVEVEEDSLEDASGAAIVVPAELVGEVLTNFKIVIAHGQEGCWIWSDFGSSFFKQESVALAVAE